MDGSSLAWQVSYASDAATIQRYVPTLCRDTAGTIASYAMYSRRRYIGAGQAWALATAFGCDDRDPEEWERATIVHVPTDREVLRISQRSAASLLWLPTAGPEDYPVQQVLYCASLCRLVVCDLQRLLALAEGCPAPPPELLRAPSPHVAMRCYFSRLVPSDWRLLLRQEAEWKKVWWDEEISDAEKMPSRDDDPTVRYRWSTASDRGPLLTQLASAGAPRRAGRTWFRVFAVPGAGDVLAQPVAMSLSSDARSDYIERLGSHDFAEASAHWSTPSTLAFRLACAPANSADCQLLTRQLRECSCPEDADTVGRLADSLVPGQRVDICITVDLARSPPVQVVRLEPFEVGRLNGAS